MKGFKFNHSLFIISTFLFIFISCESNLDIDPTVYVAESFFQSEERIQRGIGGVYAAITNIYGPQLGGAEPMYDYVTKHGFWLLPGDDITADGTENPLETFSGLNGANNIVQDTWRRFYVLISRCNFMLETIEDPDIVKLYKTEELKNYNRGEMLFLRSWAFYNLWDYFRKAPILDKVIDYENSLLSPSTDFEMLDNAISALEEAAKLLPSSWDQENLGRITKDSAYGLLVKCYAMRACYNQKNEIDYNNAITSFEKISTSRRLVHFGENFDYRTENNAESLFEFQASLQPGGTDNPWVSNDYDEGITNGQMSAFYHYWDNHWCNYMSGKMGPTQKLVNAFHPEDPRKAETYTDYADNLGGEMWWVEPEWSRFNGYQMVKYVNGKRGSVTDPIWNIGSPNNPRILRLGDVKLIVAEAYLQTGNPAEALNQVNDVRKRARASTDDGTESSEPSDLTSINMDDIINERFLELAGEGYRWTDLRRWHAAGYINLANWTAADFGFSYDANLFAFDVNTHIRYPIPNSELDRNPFMAASGNNPGY
jgi:starch-binding outer membrane protein, SusD/RagB family